MARLVRILHSALLAGMALSGAVLYLVRRMPHALPTLEIPRLGLVFAVVPALLLVVAVTALRPRVPERSTGQNADAYWNELRSRGASLVLWASIEGAGLVGAVGYFLTGATAPAVAFGLALAALVQFRPGRLEGN